MKQFLRVSFFVFTLIALASLSIADHSENSLQASQAYNSGDFKTAYGLWLIEAEKGDVVAQGMVGALYAKGKGVPQNYEESVRWYHLAAIQGYVNAQFSLGSMYLQGQGVLQSNEDAYAWWMVAAGNGHKIAQQKLIVIQAEMTPKQIEKAQFLAQEILVRIGD